MGKEGFCPARALSAFCMDRGTQWFQGSDHGSSRACKRRGLGILGDFLEEAAVGGVYHVQMSRA